MNYQSKHKEITQKIAAIRKEIGERLWKLQPENGTKKMIAVAVKECKQRKKMIRGSKSIAVAVEAFIESRELLREAKNLKMEGRLTHGYDKLSLSIKQRLSDKLRENECLIKKQLKSAYRLENVEVNFGLHGDEYTKNTVGCFESDPDWSYYSKRTRYPKVHHTLSVSLTKKWRKLFKSGHHFIDGLFNLEHEKEEDIDGIEVFSATWLQQSRGYTLEKVEGFIGHRNGVYYHAKTSAAAVRGVKRKVAIEQQEQLEEKKRQNARQKAARLSERLEQLKRFEIFGNATVTFEDARKTGACHPGIQNWCTKAGINPDLGASCAEVLSAYKNLGDKRALGAILNAIRRHRAGRFAH